MTTRRPFHVGNFLRLVVIGLWVVALMWLLGREHYTTYIRSELWPLLVAALVLGLLFFAGVYFRLGQHASHHNTSLERWVQAGILMLPLVFLVGGGTGAQLGAHAYRQRFVEGVGPRSTPRDIAASDRPPIVTSGPSGVAELSLMQLMDNVGAYRGHRVAVDGMAFNDDTMPAGQFVVFRFLIVCCAADAIPVGSVVRWSHASDITSDTWLRVEGVVDLDEIDGQPAPVIHASKVEPIDPPKNPYLSPW